jgi:hypothetical protein
MDDLRTIIDHRPVACLILSEEQPSEMRLHSITGLCQARNIDVMQGGLHLQSMSITSYKKVS